MAQLQFDSLVAKLSPSTIMGGSEYWNGPTRAPYPFWYYCNRADPASPPSEAFSTYLAPLIVLSPQTCFCRFRWYEVLKWCLPVHR